MRRSLAILMCAGLLLALLPGTAAAGRVTKFHDHHVGFFCDTSIDGGYATASIDSSSAFGDFAGADVWLDPAVPFEDPPSITGNTDTVSITEGTSEVLLSATFEAFDGDGDRLGSALLEATMTPVGAPQPITGESNGNHHSNTTGSFQELEGDATLTLAGDLLQIPGCHGDITDVSVLENSPHSSVSKNSGINMDCSWQTPEASAAFFAFQDPFGFFSGAFLSTADQTLFDTGGATGSLTTTSLTASIPLVDEATGDPYSAQAAATLTASGKPVSSTLVSQTNRVKLTEQAFVPDGQIVFSTGQTFDLDQEHCRTASFNNQVIGNNPSGPKAGGKAPANDTPDGALVVKAGTRLTAQTGATAAQPEVQVGETCPEGFGDQMGHTLWYKITGTNAPVTFDTAGSNFDTVIGVFQRDDADFTELACDDDVFYQPVGSTYQAALTFDTVAGQTYYVEVGGFQRFFDPDNPEFGLLKLKVS
jgi:hypothetical protein